MNYYEHEFVCDDWDGDYGYSHTTRSFYECQACGAIVRDREVHTAWHGAES